VKKLRIDGLDAALALLLERSPIDPAPRVCRFYGRCPEGFERCRHEMPVLRSVGHGPLAVACHRLEGERLERSLGG
jgi:hypothetical protein